MRALVPMICNTTKKSDTTRSSILRLTANFLRVSRLFPQDAEGTQTSEKSFLGEGLPHLESMEDSFSSLQKMEEYCLCQKILTNSLDFLRLK